jgi:hypothetical protein
VILLKDGVGGHGLRAAIAFLDPYSHTLSLIQEQVSMTGVLLNDGFSLDPDTSIMALRTENRLDQRNRLYREANGYRSGSWFSSRSIQAQLLEHARPTRQRVERINSPGAPPTLQSSVGTPLHNVYYRDEAGKLWYTAILNTGERKELESIQPAPFNEWLKAHHQQSGMRMQMAFDRVAQGKEMFYADVREDNELFVETLESIRWKNRGFVLTGLVETGGVL